MLRSIFQYLDHRINSRKWTSFHSPYLYELFTYACDDQIVFPAFHLLEEKRKSFYLSALKIKRMDYGAGSNYQKTQTITSIRTIAKSALSHPFQCRFMSRLARWTSSATILEFGTSLGISTAYIAAGATTGIVTTVEGDPAIAAVAGKLFEDIKSNNIKLVNVRFEDFLNELSIPLQYDLIFIDGNHRKESLLEYYRDLRPYMKPETMIIVDDIYWSQGMNEGWKDLISYPEITQSVDCFQFGILFFSPHFMQKQHHKVHLPFRSVLM